MVISNRSTPPRTEIVSTTIGHASCMHADVAGSGGHMLSQDGGKNVTSLHCQATVEKD